MKAVSKFAIYLLVMLAVSAFCSTVYSGEPVKIFILAGQSNMLGQGNMNPTITRGTLSYIAANDPYYSFLKDTAGNWVVRDDVWIKDQDPSYGGLTVGYGAISSTIGPELGFGHFMGDLFEEHILLVKAAWGGKSLAVDFRPPSSGWSAPPAASGDEGYYYQQLVDLINDALANLSTYVPGYNPADGYEFAGFGWHQGWNDQGDTYTAEYEANMTNFINDIRAEVREPDLPFVIATTGMAGNQGTETYSQLELNQLAIGDPAKHPDFVGNVGVIDTRQDYENLRFWQPAADSPSSQGYHWNNNAKTYTNIGLAMADMMSLMAKPRTPYRLRAEGAAGSGVNLTWQNGTEIPTSVRILRDSVEIAAAAPVNPATFYDSTPEPGIYNYELIFTMPGNPAGNLTRTFNGGITNLEASINPSNIVLTWKNNMAYDAIEIKRNGTVLEAAWSGTAESYTDSSPLTSGLITYSVVPTNGSAAPATVQLDFSLQGELGLLDVFQANGGINPVTGSEWAEGDQYRLVFVTSGTTQATSTDIAYYNNFVQSAADAAGLGGVTWNCIGSAATVDARDNTGTNKDNPSHVDVSIYLMDGSTMIASSNRDLWDKNIDYPVNIDENGNTVGSINVFTGTGLYGEASGPLGNAGGVTVGITQWTDARYWIRIFGYPSTNSLPIYGISEPLTIGSGVADLFVDAGNDKISWSGQGVQMAPTVVNNYGTNLIYNWSANPSTGVVFSPNDSDPAPTVTITNAPTSNPSAVTITLAVNNVGRTEPDVEDNLQIDVYDNACKAASIGLNRAVDHPTDMSGNCITNLEDFAVLAMAWLESSGLSEPYEKPAE